MNVVLGEFKKQKEGFFAFIPNAFLPKDGFSFDEKLIKKGGEATRLLGKLDGITKLLPDSDFFLLMYLKKDAAASSQIEGTMATMTDAIEAEIGSRANIPADVDDILHYIKALNYGIKRVTTEDFPLSLRFLRELHKQLMDKARATHFSDPGEFRSSQNWIGGTRPDNAHFVPPPVEDMKRALGDLELFIHADDTILPIFKAGLIHAQFETLHPFLDGNGRTGRMLITFYLWKEMLLEKPVLFLSSYFKKHQQIYYEKLFGYHHGEIREWLDFFLDGVIETAQNAITIVHDITVLREQDMMKIQKLGKRASESAITVLPMLYSQPIVNVETIQRWTGFTFSGAQKVIDRFVQMEILSLKHQNKKYGQSYVYKKYLEIFINPNE